MSARVRTSQNAAAFFFFFFGFFFVCVRVPVLSKKRVFEPRIELGTFCVLGRRDNQLHHPNATGDDM
jgi:hypothetical protein